MRKFIGIIIIMSMLLFSFSNVYAGLDNLNVTIKNLDDIDIYYQILYKPMNETNSQMFDNEWYYYNRDWTLDKIDVNRYHFFVEEGFPKIEYKIAIKLPDGTIKTTDSIRKRGENQWIDIDGMTMKVIEDDNRIPIKEIIIIVSICIFSVIIVLVIKNKKKK